MITAEHPFTFVLFGASGHLARQKIYPALFTLALKDRFPEHYAVIGYARTDMTEEGFRALVAEAIQKDMPGTSERELADFLTHVHYQRGQYDQLTDFQSLADRIATMEKQWGVGTEAVRLAYLSVPPQVFVSVIHKLCEGGVRAADRPFRVIVEKPVGHDLASFRTVEQQLIRCFREEEIYLLDHYLGKDAVRNVYYLRYANPVMAQLLTNAVVEHVEITAMESDGAGDRAGYFEGTGTFRDMFQSHLLLLASLLTMPLRHTEEEIKESRLSALRRLTIPEASSLGDVVLQGQYQAGTVAGQAALGYTAEKGVAATSRTNTYAALALETREPLWAGVPFFLRSGKRLTKKETRITLDFRDARGGAPHVENNRLDIILQGEAGLRMHLQTKMGGTEPLFRPLIMEDPLVCYGDCLPEHGLLLLEAIRGKKHWFLSFSEVLAAWELIDPLQAHLDKPETPLHPYAAGSRGPAAADTWIAARGCQWF